MTINLKKKKLTTILISSFLFITLLLSSLAYFYSFYWSPINIGEYQEILEVCEINRRKDLKVTCTALLKYFEDKGESTSNFYLTIITPEDDFKNFEYTLEEGQYSNEDLDLAEYDFESTLPVYVEFIFEKQILGTYSLKRVDKTRIPDDEVYSLTMALSEKNRVIPNIQTEEEISIESRGYYFSNPLEITEDEGFERVYFFNSEIDEVAVEGDEILLNISFELNGEQYNSSFQTANLLINNQIYSSENIDDYEFDSTYQTGFFFLLEESELSRDSLLSYCSKEDLITEELALCGNLEDTDLNEIEIGDFESYFQNLLDGTNNGFVNMDKLILTSIINR